MAANGKKLTTPIFEELCGTEQVAKDAAAEITKAREMWIKHEKSLDRAASQGPNIVINNALSNNNTNNIAGPNINMSQGGASATAAAPAAAPVAAPEQVGMTPAIEADEMFTCLTGPMGFNLDWEREDKRVIATVRDESGLKGFGIACSLL